MTRPPARTCVVGAEQRRVVVDNGVRGRYLRHTKHTLEAVAIRTGEVGRARDAHHTVGVVFVDTDGFDKEGVAPFRFDVSPGVTSD